MSLLPAFYYSFFVSLVFLAFVSAASPSSFGPVLPKPPIARVLPAAVEINGNLLVLGGATLEANATDDAFAFNPDDKTWHRVPQSGIPPTHLGSSAVLSADNTVAMYAPNQIQAPFWQLDPATWAWTYSTMGISYLLSF